MTRHSSAPPLRLLLTLLLTVTSGDPYSSPEWQCVKHSDATPDCAACTASLVTLSPDINPATVEEYYENCHAEDITSLRVSLNDGIYIIGDHNSYDAIHIEHVQYQTSRAGCRLHSAQALLRRWCHGLTYCIIPEYILISYVMNSRSFEQDCTANFTEDFTLFIKVIYKKPARWMTQDELHIPCRNGWKLNRETCFEVTPVPTSFMDAREWCLQKGGDLADVFPDLEYSWVTETFGNLVSVWVIGQSEKQRSVRYYTSPEQLQPAIFSDDGVYLCSSDGPCSDLLGLCSFPLATEDVVSLTSLASSQCPQKICVNEGTCYHLQGGRVMCDCPPGFYGDTCECGQRIRQIRSPDGLIKCEGINGSHFALLEDEYSSEKTLSLDAKGKGKIYVEFAHFGSVPGENINIPQGCLSTHFLQVLQTRCNNRMKCTLSHRDLRHQLSSDCPRMITPRLKIRYSYQEEIGLCEQGHYLIGNTELPAGCYDTVTKIDAVNNLGSKEACLGVGGDLVYSKDYLSWTWLCHEFKNSFNYSMDYNFWQSSHYNASIKLGRSVECGQTPISSYLCVFPVKKGRTVCAKQKPLPDLYPGYSFEESNPGLARAPCPVPFKGNSTWKCGTDGQWFGTPNMTMCKGLDLTDQIEELSSDDRTRTAAQIVTESGGKANTAATLATGDVLDLAKILTVAQVQNKKDIKEATTPDEKRAIAELMIISTAALTDTIVIIPNSWVGMTTSEARFTLTDLQTSVSDAAVTFGALVVNTTRDIQESALQIRISQHPKEYYTEEKRTFHSHLNTETQIKLPENFYERYEKDGSVEVVFTSYDNLHCLLNQIPCQTSDVNISAIEITEPQVNSYVIGANVGTNSSWQADEGSFVEITFSHLYHGNQVTLENRTCSFWNTAIRDWDTGGCEPVSIRANSTTTCRCNHLTNLAVIMDINGVMSGNKAVEVITKWVTLIGCPISLACLAVTVLVLLGFEKVRKRGPNVLRAHICINLMMAELLLLTGLDATANKLGCTFIAAFLHYFFLATFTWSALLSFKLYRISNKVFGALEPIPLRYYAVGYGVPLILVSITVGATKGTCYGTESFCWLDTSTGLIWAFAGPMACILLCNVLFYGLLINVLWVKGRNSTNFDKGRKNTPLKNEFQNAGKAKDLEHEKIKKKIYGSIGYFIILGITWITGFFYMSEGGAFMAIPFTVLNAFQGLVIFLLTVVKDDVIMKEIRKKLGLKIVGPDGQTITSSEFKTPTRNVTQRSKVGSTTHDF